MPNLMIRFILSMKLKIFSKLSIKIKENKLRKHLKKPINYALKVNYLRDNKKKDMPLL